MLEQPKYSIIIPAYNAEQTLKRCLESIEKQTYIKFEVIIIDDGSEDETYALIKSLAANNPRIKYRHIENSGPGKARNVGIPLAKGQYVIFIDVDDYLKPNFLENYNLLLENNDFDLVISSYVTKVYDNEELVSEQATVYPSKRMTSHESFLQELYPLMNSQMMYVVWNKVYKRDLIQNNKIFFPDYRSCEDRIFNLRYFEHVKSAIVTDLINFNYSFDGKNSLTNRYFDNKFDTFIHWNRLLLSLTNENKDGYASLFLKGVMSCLMALHSETCPLTFREKKDYIENVVNHLDVIEASRISSNETTIKKIIALLLRSRQVHINYYASKVIHLVSQNSPRIIEKFKSSY